jgi:hypothetical protein
MAAEPMKRVLFAATALLFASCSVPTRSVVPLFDHPIGAGKQHLWDHDAESLRRPEIDHEFEFRRRPNRKIRWLRTAKDAIHVAPHSLPDLRVSAAAVDDESSQNNEK